MFLADRIFRIELNRIIQVLRSLVFVFDAYLCYEKKIEEGKSLFLQQGQPEQTTHNRSVKCFFQRSNSMCFPGSSLTEAWDTLDKMNAKVPLAEKCHILAPDSDQTALFAPPPSSHNWRDYLEVRYLRFFSENVIF